MSVFWCVVLLNRPHINICETCIVDFYVCVRVNDGFDKNDIPVDVIWLDIEHTDGKR